MNSETGVSTNHIIIYFDTQCAEIDGRGWCVDTSDSEITERFGTFLEATMYSSKYTPWLMGKAESTTT